VVFWRCGRFALSNELVDILFVSQVFIHFPSCFRVDTIELFLYLSLLLQKCFVAMVQTDGPAAEIPRARSLYAALARHVRHAVHPRTYPQAPCFAACEHTQIRRSFCAPRSCSLCSHLTVARSAERWPLKTVLAFQVPFSWPNLQLDVTVKWYLQWAGFRQQLVNAAVRSARVQKCRSWSAQWLW